MVGAEIALASMRRMYFAHMEGREICYLADKKAEYISSKRADHSSANEKRNAADRSTQLIRIEIKSTRNVYVNRDPPPMAPI